MTVPLALLCALVVGLVLPARAWGPGGARGRAAAAYVRPAPQALRAPLLRYVPRVCASLRRGRGCPQALLSGGTGNATPPGGSGPVVWGQCLVRCDTSVRAPSQCRSSQGLGRTLVGDGGSPPPPPPPRDAPGQRHGATAPSPGRPTPGVVKQDKSSGGSVDTTKTRSGPQRVRMSSGERPIGAATGTPTHTRALCQPPPPPPIGPPKWTSQGPTAAVGGGPPPALRGMHWPTARADALLRAAPHTRAVEQGQSGGTALPRVWSAPSMAD